MPHSGSLCTVSQHHVPVASRPCAWNPVREELHLAKMLYDEDDMRSVRRDVETGLQTGLETVVKYIQTVQTIK